MSVEYNCVLIRFGEIFLKGNNRKYFEDLLINNIKSALKPFKYTFLRSQGRYYIEDFENIDEIVSALTKVFGIHSVSPALKVKTDKETLFEAAVKMSPMSGKFRVTVKRADKRLPFTSEEMAGNIGGALLRASGGKLKVDLFDHDFDLHVDIRDNGYSYLFYDKIPGAGGLPVGCSGNGMLLLSGGIDSPVAGARDTFSFFPLYGRTGITKGQRPCRKTIPIYGSGQPPCSSVYGYPIRHSRKLPGVLYDNDHEAFYDEDRRKNRRKRRMRSDYYRRKPGTGRQPNHAKHERNQFGGQVAGIQTRSRLR